MDKTTNLTRDPLYLGARDPLYLGAIKSTQNICKIDCSIRVS